MPTPYKQPHYDVFAAIPFVQQPALGDAPHPWAERHLEEVPNVAALSKTPHDRAQVRAVCRDAAQPVLFGYVCAMVWGGQGKGPGRLKRAKAVWAERAKIAGPLTRLRAGGVTRREAFDLFCGEEQVKGLGPSYFTKLLYFFSPATDCYIMDQWTSKSINLLTGKSVVHIYDSSPTRRNTGENYQAFCEEIDHLAQLLGQTGDQIEQRLMSKGGRNRAPWRAHVKAHYPYDKARMHFRYPHIPLADL